MAGGLRYESGRDMPPGMQVLAAGKMLELEAAAMLQAIKQVDMDCTFCKHANCDPPCTRAVPMVFCNNCGYVCHCKGCVDNCRYEWCGAVEARMRMKMME